MKVILLYRENMACVCTCKNGKRVDGKQITCEPI